MLPLQSSIDFQLSKPTTWADQWCLAIRRGISSHTGGRSKLKAARGVAALCHCFGLLPLQGKGTDLVLFPNDAVFWATHEVAQVPTSGGRSLPLSKRQEVRVIKLRSRKEERKGEDQSAAFPRRREASQCLENRPPQTSGVIKQLNGQEGSSNIRTELQAYIQPKRAAPSARVCLLCTRPTQRSLPCDARLQEALPISSRVDAGKIWLPHRELGLEDT